MICYQWYIRGIEYVKLMRKKRHIISSSFSNNEDYIIYKPRDYTFSNWIENNTEVWHGYLYCHRRSQTLEIMNEIRETLQPLLVFTIPHITRSITVALYDDSLDYSFADWMFTIEPGAITHTYKIRAPDIHTLFTNAATFAIDLSYLEWAVRQPI